MIKLFLNIRKNRYQYFIIKVLFQYSCSSTLILRILIKYSNKHLILANPFHENIVNLHIILFIHLISYKNIFVIP